MALKCGGGPERTADVGRRLGGSGRVNTFGGAFAVLLPGAGFMILLLACSKITGPAFPVKASTCVFPAMRVSQERSADDGGAKGQASWGVRVSIWLTEITPRSMDVAQRASREEGRRWRSAVLN